MELIVNVNKKHNVPEVGFIILPLNYLGAVVLIAFYNSSDREIQKKQPNYVTQSSSEKQNQQDIYIHIQINRKSVCHSS